MVIIIVIIISFVVFVAIIFIMITITIVIITVVVICVFIKQLILRTRANELVAIAVPTHVDVFNKQQLLLIRLCIYICTLLTSKLPQQE
jgi:hypothetical protein